MDTIVLMNVITIQLFEVAVRLRRDDHLQFFSLLCADRLVSRVVQICALWWRGWASRRRSPFFWWPLSLLFISSMCAHILNIFADLLLSYCPTLFLLHVCSVSLDNYCTVGYPFILPFCVCQIDVSLPFIILLCLFPTGGLTSSVFIPPSPLLPGRPAM